MKVLVIGSGGREHALVWKIAQSRQVDKLYCAPGNGGIDSLAECVNIKVEDLQGLLDFAIQNRIDLTVVGPEVPLSLGIVDLFEAKGLRIFGPNKEAAQLESSKAFSKDFMQKYGIPTAKYMVYEDYSKAVSEVDSFGYPVVLKADGLAAGKGVIIAADRQEAVAAIEDILLDKKFGSAGSRVVIEEYLTGKEASILAFSDGRTIVPMVSAQDYKRALDNDKGLNTGGMGAVSPAFYYNDEIAEVVKHDIIEATLNALNSEGISYKGIIYFGLMLTDKGPKVLEYNARFGDPETEAVLPRLKSDLVEIMDAVIDCRLKDISIEWDERAAVCVVMASGGYPGEYRNGYEISGLEAVDGHDVTVFHAGTKKSGDSVLTSGGRVLVVSALADSVEKARALAYKNVEKISFEAAFYRRDIAVK